MPFVQFRNKNDLPPRFDDIKSPSKVIINDSLEVAEQFKAWGVHLGQEDLSRYPEKRILERRIKLGLSTHSDAEIKRALKFSPDYIAFGPIYPTTAKPMAFGPQGLERLREVVLQVSVPVIAIGGLTEESLPEVLASGVCGAAMISGLANKSMAEISNMISLCERFQS